MKKMTTRKVFITGSADGLGKAAAKTLLKEGHEVVLHVRAQERLSAINDLLKLPGASVVICDLSRREETINLAEKLNDLGRMDAVIHNAGVYHGSVHEVNVVAPYILTALMQRPERLIYLSSGMHSGGHAHISKIDWNSKNANVSYFDSKLFITTFAAALAKLWPETYCNSVNPGWVPTKMGGANAPDDLRLGHLTQEWLATSDDAAALTSGVYWFHQKHARAHTASSDAHFQNQLLDSLAKATGYSLKS